jgi:hypothetical protein
MQCHVVLRRVFYASLTFPGIVAVGLELGKKRGPASADCGRGKCIEAYLRIQQEAGFIVCVIITYQDRAHSDYVGSLAPGLNFFDYLFLRGFTSYR